PSLRYLLDGDGGDENLKDYPLEDSDLTLSSVLKNPLLYQEGWGIDAIKHSLTYSGGLSRAYVRTYAPAQRYGFTAFSPYTDRRAADAVTAAVERQRRTPLHAEGGGGPRRRARRHRYRDAGLPKAALPGRRGRRELPPLARQQGLVPADIPAPVGRAPARRLGP